MSKCPVCGTDGAYIGLSKVECLNRDCKYFDETLILKQDSSPKDSQEHFPACEPDIDHSISQDGGFFNPFFQPPYSNPNDPNAGCDSPDQTGHPSDPNNVIDNPCSLKKEMPWGSGFPFSSNDCNSWYSKYLDMVERFKKTEAFKVAYMPKSYSAQQSYSQCKLLNDYASKRFIDKFHKLGDFI